MPHNPTDERGSIDTIKGAVSKRLKGLTTHIENEMGYEETVQQLNAVGVDYLNPSAVNDTIQNLSSSGVESHSSSGFLSRLGRGMFTLLNFHPLYYGIVFTIATLLWNPLIGSILAIGLFAFNGLFTRLN